MTPLMHFIKIIRLFKFDWGTVKWVVINGTAFIMIRLRSSVDEKGVK